MNYEASTSGQFPKTFINSGSTMHSAISILRQILVSLTLLSMISCGSDDKSREQAQIIDMSFDQSVIAVGESAVLTVRFFYSVDLVFDDQDSVIVLLRVPSELQFRLGSSVIQQATDGTTVGPRISNCAGSGETFLEFNFDRRALQLASDPEGKANAALLLTFDAVAANPQTPVVGDAANQQINFRCGEDLIGDSIVNIAIN